MQVQDAACSPCTWSSSTCHLETKSWRDLCAWGCPAGPGTVSLCPGAPERGAFSRCAALQVTRPQWLRHITLPGTWFTLPRSLAISSVGRGTRFHQRPVAHRPPPPHTTDRSFGNGFLKRPVRRVARRSRAQPPEGSSCRAGRARGFPGVGRSEVGCSLRPTATLYPRPPRPPATPPGQGRAHRGRLVNIDGLFFVRQRFRLHELDKHERFGKTPGEAGKRDLIRVREASARTLALGFLPFHTQSRAATGREDPRGPL